MRYRFQVGPREVAVIVCAATLLGLVFAEGWIWPLKAAALVLPLSLLVG